MNIQRRQRCELRIEVDEVFNFEFVNEIFMPQYDVQKDVKHIRIKMTVFGGHDLQRLQVRFFILINSV